MFSLTPSQIIEFLYCPRYTFFEHVLRIPQNEKKYFKVMKGREIHDERLERNKNYLRKKVGVTEKWLDQYLTHSQLRGKVDEVLALEDGTMAPLDYKFAQWKGKIYETYRQQLYCYAWLIEHNFNKKVEQGYIIYVRSKYKLVEVKVTEKAKKMVESSIQSMQEIIQQNKYPKATKYKRRCLNCTYRNICTK